MTYFVLRAAALAALSLLFTACPKSSAGPLATGEVTAEEAVCRSDRDCTLMPDCCGCEQGGLQMGVHVDNVEHAHARQQEECTERTCTGEPSSHRSCTATSARCLGGRCIPAL